MKIAAIIQARLGSRRLPGKVLMPLAGRPAIAHVVERSRMIPDVTDVVVATTTSPRDDELAAWCAANGVTVCRGSEDDVLDRYYQAARSVGADVIVRITADCPLLDPIEAGKVVRALVDSGCDYASNYEPATFPDGLDIGVLTFATLERVWKKATRKSEREHVWTYIPSHADEFTRTFVHCARDLSHYRLTFDEKGDYEAISAMIEALHSRGQFGYLDEIVALLEEQPDLLAANRTITRNEGLAKSLAEDDSSQQAEQAKQQKQ